MSLNTIDTSINLTQIEDQVAALLHAYGVIPERAEVLHIDFGAADDHGMVPLKVSLRQEIQIQKEVKLVT